MAEESKAFHDAGDGDGVRERGARWLVDEHQMSSRYSFLFRSENGRKFSPLSLRYPHHTDAKHRWHDLLQKHASSLCILFSSILYRELLSLTYSLWEFWDCCTRWLTATTH